MLASISDLLPAVVRATGALSLSAGIAWGLVRWFNPLSWWVVRNLDVCAEWLCDDEATGGDQRVATEYAEVLLRLGQAAGNCGVSATAMRGGRLHSRICR